MLIAPALVLAAVDTAGFHLTGARNLGVLLARVSLVFSALLLAGLRVFEGKNPSSLPRGLLMSAAVMVLESSAVCRRLLSNSLIWARQPLAGA